MSRKLSAEFIGLCGAAMVVPACASAQTDVDLNILKLKPSYSASKDYPAIQDNQDYGQWKVKPSEPSQSLIYPTLPAFGNYPLSVKPTIQFGGKIKINKDIKLSAQFETETEGLKRFRSKTPTEAGEMQIGMERAARIKLSIAF